MARSGKPDFSLSKISDKPVVDGGHCKEILSHVAAASVIGIIAASVTFYHRRKPKAQMNQKVIPRIDRTGSGRFGKLERFSDYVARQLDFSDVNECPQLRKLTIEYLRMSKGCEDSIFEYFSGEPEAESLWVKLIEEIDKCILSYFAFHWSQSSLLISQVLSVESEQNPKFKNFVLAATRKQRFARVTKDLKVKRMFSTLMEEMKAIGTTADSTCTNVMAPVAHNQRSPVLLLMGGGMGAGKSTVLKDILKEPLWSEAAANAVVVEADAFKETDVIYRALSSSGHHHDMLQTAELVHQSSTDAASSLLVTALNEGRDVIMDGTLSWVPFVTQTIEMAKNVHKSRFRMGVGYQVKQDGTVIESYWEKVEEEDGDQVEKERRNRKPYRIELVGVVCDAYLAVVRGIRRAVMVGRAVRVNSQLKSHKRFASAFPSYCHLVDNARLYCTNAMGGPAKLIGWKDGDSKLLVDPDEIKCLNVVSNLNDDADSIYELYADQSFLNEPGSIWKEIVSSPSRNSIQLELRTSIQAIEKSKASSSEDK